jgi:uncharacterized SAM-binding protein YcdF (DUF218 family)
VTARDDRERARLRRRGEPIRPARVVEPNGLTVARTARRALRTLGAVALIALGVTTLTPLPTWLAARYAEQPRLAPADAIVVLGGGFADGALGDPSLQRVVHGIDLQRRGLAPLLVLSGEAPRQGSSEAGVRAQLAQDLGVPPAAIVTQTANTTRDEARAAAALLKPRGVRSVLLVTSSLHLVRARGAFERVGFEVLPAPADRSFFLGSKAAERLDAARALARECTGWLYYRLAGYL